MGCDIQPWASPQDRRRAATKAEDPYCDFDVNRTEGSATCDLIWLMLAGENAWSPLRDFHWIFVLR